MCYPWSENQPKGSVNSVVWNGTLVGGSGQHLAGRGMSSHRFGVYGGLVNSISVWILPGTTLMVTLTTVSVSRWRRSFQKV